jgi:endonuclease YncB( thermonuclease family)
VGETRSTETGDELMGGAMAATNRLEISGTIDLGQFWPDGESDADTTKIVLAVAAGSVRVQLSQNATMQATSAYDDAVIITGRKKDGDLAVKPVVKNGALTVRLQRIDAPELHYRPDARGSNGKLKGTGLIKPYRQRQGETATLELRSFLQSFGQDPLPCTFTSELKPSEGPGAAIDKYGRFVGDLVLQDGTNLNLWILAQGLAIVALYDSMLPGEIDESLSAWQTGRASRTGIASHYSSRFLSFDDSLVFRPPGSSPALEGRRRFIHPKFYRRQTTWWAFSRAGIFPGDFPDWLASKNDVCWHLPEFKARGRKAPRYPLYDRDFDGNRVGWPPEAFIFAESGSQLKRPVGANRFETVRNW